MFTSTWCVIAPILLFVLSMFLTCTGFSNFCSQNPCLAAIFLSINIPVVPLSKSTFTVTPLYISIFSTPIFSHTSLSILNILLTSFCSLLFLAVPFGPSVHMLPYCTFPSVGHSTSSQFYHSLFLPTLYSGHRIFFLSHSNTFLTIASLLLYFTYSTLIISSFFASLSL